MSTLVTGICGFFASHIAKSILDEGEKVVSLDQRPLSGVSLDALRPYIDENMLIPVRGDVCDISKLIKYVKKFDITRVIHAAGMHGSPCKDRPLDCLNVNLVGTANVLEAARLCDLQRIVYTSSRAVYPVGLPDEMLFLTEDMALEPMHGSVYGISKAASDLLGLEYAGSYGVDFVSCRFPSVYGPGMAYALSCICPLVTSVIQGKPFKMVTGGEQKFEYLYVKDAVSGISLALKAHSLKHRVFNIGTGRLTSLFDLAHIVKGIIKDAVIELGPGWLTKEKAAAPLAIKRAQEYLQYVPGYSIEKGVAEYIENLQKQIENDRKR